MLDYEGIAISGIRPTQQPGRCSDGPGTVTRVILNYVSEIRLSAPHSGWGERRVNVLRLITCGLYLSSRYKFARLTRADPRNQINGSQAVGNFGGFSRNSYSISRETEMG
jgi:hypothetical protein